MKIFSWNVNGIRAVEKKGALKDFLTNENPDIFCMQETKIQSDQCLAEKFDEKYPEYRKYYSFAQRKGYSGTAIWLKNEVEVLQSLHNFSDEILSEIDLYDKYGNAANEGRICAVELKDFWILTVYTPNSKGDLSRIPLRENWDKAFLKFALELQNGKHSAPKPVIFCGDLNVAHTEIDLANPKQNKGKHGFTLQERGGFDNFLENDFLDILRQQNPGTEKLFTWWSYYAKSRERNVGWRIDYFLISKSLEKLAKKAEIYPQIMGSDHCPTSLEIICEK